MGALAKVAESFPHVHHGYVADTVGTRVARVRRLRGMKRHHLDMAIGHSSGYVQRLETTGRSPRTDTLRKLAKALECRLEYLADGELPIETEPQEERYPNREKAIARMGAQWEPWLAEQLRSLALHSKGDPSVDAWISPVAAMPLARA